jgi:DNA processing protein
MIDSARGARMLLSCAMDCCDPSVAELVQNIGAEGAWAKVIEGVLGEPAAQRAARVSVDAVEGQVKAAAVRYVVPGDEEWPAGLDDLRQAESVQSSLRPLVSQPVPGMPGSPVTPGMSWSPPEC